MSDKMRSIRIDIPLGVASPSFKSYWVTYDEACRLKEQLEEKLAPIRQAKYEAEVHAASYRQPEGLAALPQNPWGAGVENRITDLEDFKEKAIFRFVAQETKFTEWITAFNIYNQSRETVDHTEELHILKARIASLESSVFELYEGKE